MKIKYKTWLWSSLLQQPLPGGAFDNIAISGGSVASSTDSVLLSWRAKTGRKDPFMKSPNLPSNDWNVATGTLVGVPGDLSVSANLELPGLHRMDIQLKLIWKETG